MSQSTAHPFRLERDGVTIDGEWAGEGPAILLLHGLTATRRYVVHGSRLLERSGHRVIQYDARGHGLSSAAPTPERHDYTEMALDAIAVLDHLGERRAVLVGQSMGAATAVNVALNHPERVAGLVLITPAHRGRPSSPRALERWDRLAQALLDGGPEGFVAALEPFTLDERLRDAVRTVVVQRLSRHPDRETMAQAIRNVPRSQAFAGMDQLARISAPTLLVGSLDSSDPDHPVEIAEEYARRIPGARYVIEEAGQSPLAWRGGALSREILALAQRAGDAGGATEAE